MNSKWKICKKFLNKRRHSAGVTGRKMRLTRGRAVIDRGENRGNGLPIPRAAVAVEIPAGDPENPLKKKMINDTVNEQEINGIQRTGVESPVPRGREDKIEMKDPGKIRME